MIIRRVVGEVRENVQVDVLEGTGKSSFTVELTLLDDNSVVCHGDAPSWASIPSKNWLVRKALEKHLKAGEARLGYVKQALREKASTTPP